MKLRGLAFLFIAIMLACPFISCADKSSRGGTGQTGEATSETAVTETETEVKAEIPNQDYGGYDFHILHWWVSGWESRLDKDLYAEAETGDVLKDAVYKRNLAVSEELGVIFSVEYKNYDQIASAVQKAVGAGDDSYDLVYCRTYESPPLVTGGFLSDFKSMPYVDLEKPWWDHNAVSNLSIAGKLYLAASDINVIDKDATAVITFNKKMAGSLNLPDLYALVNSGAWTIDKMTSLYKNAAQDVDGDGKMSLDDIWGFIAGRDVPTAFFNGAGATFAAKDENDLPVYTFDNEYSYSVTDKIVALMNDKTCFYNHHTGTDAAAKTDDNQYRQLFENGKGLFFWTRLDDVTAMRSSETDFGILPIPKYEEAQEKYYSLVSIHTEGLMSVPVTASDLERTSAVLEDMAYHSHSLVQPAYKEVALKGKYIRDEESSSMLDLIFSNRVFDIGIIYRFGDFSSAYESIDGDKKGAAALYASKQAKIQSDIQKFIDTVNSLQ